MLKKKKFICVHTQIEVPGTTQGNLVPVQGEKIGRADKDQTPEMVVGGGTVILANIFLSNIVLNRQSRLQGRKIVASLELSRGCRVTYGWHCSQLVGK